MSGLPPKAEIVAAIANDPSLYDGAVVVASCDEGVLLAVVVDGTLQCRGPSPSEAVEMAKSLVLRANACVKGGVPADHCGPPTSPEKDTPARPALRIVKG